jgi:hypothetical protein
MAKTDGSQDFVEQPTAFTKAELIAHAKAFGTKPQLMAGALHGAPETMTKEEAQQRLEAWLKRPIKNEK